VEILADEIDTETLAGAEVKSPAHAVRNGDLALTADDGGSGSREGRSAVRWQADA